MLETMTLALPDVDGYLDSAAFDEIVNALEGKTALVIGPGIGTREGTVALVHRLVNEIELPMVLDADAINAFEGKADLLKNAKADIIMTPHPGEMARLIGSSTSEVQENRVEVARELAQRLGIHVVLKGYRTVIAEPGGEVYINMSGNPGMATAGAGDVLTGMIAALLGQQDSTALEAAITGVYLHGLAGDIARSRVGENALTASAIMDSIADAFLTIEEVEEHNHDHGE
jgi:NAD(P)H-hydrate epimerase